jgi:hypothetical protein
MKPNENTCLGAFLGRFWGPLGAPGMPNGAQLAPKWAHFGGLSWYLLGALLGTLWEPLGCQMRKTKNTRTSFQKPWELDQAVCLTWTL